MDTVWVTGIEKRTIRKGVGEGKISSKWVPHSVTEVEKWTRYAICHLLFFKSALFMHPRAPNTIHFHFYISIFLHDLSIVPKEKKNSYYDLIPNSRMGLVVLIDWGLATLSLARCRSLNTYVRVLFSSGRQSLCCLRNSESVLIICSKVHFSLLASDHLSKRWFQRFSFTLSQRLFSNGFRTSI